MKPEDYKVLIGIIPDVNTDFVDESRIDKDLEEMYNLIRQGQLYNKPTNLSRAFSTVEKIKKLQEKKDNDTLTLAEEKQLIKLESTIGRK
jgi:hypothetical protein